ncbi:hypothetical protein [Aliikangiella maris]|uniref:Uncharacterized protein n=2 Tax=Aliikangiella maris TaxID=3162458 RepID=A0ABV3MTT7_9GAMM
MAEFISINGQVLIKPSCKDHAEEIADRFGELGITAGYMSTILTLTVSGVFELDVSAECVISESLAFREIIRELDHIMCSGSMISISQPDENDPWNTVVELNCKPAVVRQQKLYLPKATVVRVPK